MTNRGLKVFIVLGSLALVATGVALYAIGVFDKAPELTPVPAIEVSSTDPAVQEQVRTARARLEASPYDAGANGRLGVLYEVYQYPEAARVCYERASELSPADFRWKYYLARIDRLAGDNPAATVSILTSALAINDRYTPAIALLGEAYLDLGRIDEAEQAFRRALSISQRSCSGLVGLGKTLARKGDHAGAIEQLQRAIQVAPQHAPAHYALGLAYRAVGDERAEEHLRIGQEGKSANPDFDPLVAELHDQELGINSDYRKATRTLNARQYDEAIAMLREIVEKAPDHFGARGALAKALSLTNRSQEALAEYEEAVKLNPTNIDFLRPYALLLYRAKRFGEAEASLRKVLDLGGDHQDDHHILGAILMQQQRLDDAARHFGMALERKPDHAEARRALVQVLRRQSSVAKDDAAAVPYLERIADLTPLNIQSWTVLGGTKAKVGDLRGALLAFERALAINPDLPEVIERRDEVLSRIDSGGG